MCAYTRAMYKTTINIVRTRTYRGLVGNIDGPLSRGQNITTRSYYLFQNRSPENFVFVFLFFFFEVPIYAVRVGKLVR